MNNTQPVTEIIRKRISTRSYQTRSLSQADQRSLQKALSKLKRGPLGGSARFKLVAANDQDRSALKGMITYGLIKDPQAFILGASESSPFDLEDFGYLMEQAILEATELGLGTCWLGGSFNHGRFAEKMELQAGEFLPAATAVGYIPEDWHWRNVILRQVVGATKRLAWEKIFFEGGFEKPLTQDKAGVYAEALEMLRLGPSASNKQPWRVVQNGKLYHFYLARTPGYNTRSGLASRMVVSDLQRADIGIAMCHFELSARQAGLNGQWGVNDPGLAVPNKDTSYVVSWTAE